MGILDSNTHHTVSCCCGRWLAQSRMKRSSKQAGPSLQELLDRIQQVTKAQSQRWGSSRVVGAEISLSSHGQYCNRMSLRKDLVVYKDQQAFSSKWDGCSCGCSWLFAFQFISTAATAQRVCTGSSCYNFRHNSSCASCASQ